MAGRGTRRCKRPAFIAMVFNVNTCIIIHAAISDEKTSECFLIYLFSPLQISLVLVNVNTGFSCKIRN